MSLGLAYSSEGYLRKNPLLGTIFASDSVPSTLAAKMLDSFDTIYKQALDDGARQREDFLETFKDTSPFETSVKNLQDKVSFHQTGLSIRGKDPLKWSEKDHAKFLNPKKPFKSNQVHKLRAHELAKIIDEGVTPLAEQASSYNMFFGPGTYDYSGPSLLDQSKKELKARASTHYPNVNFKTQLTVPGVGGY